MPLSRPDPLKLVGPLTNMLEHALAQAVTPPEPAQAHPEETLSLNPARKAILA